MVNINGLVEFEFVTGLLANPAQLPMVEHVEPEMLEHEGLRHLYRRIRETGGFSTPTLVIADLNVTQDGRNALYALSRGMDPSDAMEAFWDQGEQASPAEDLANRIHDTYLNRQAAAKLEAVRRDQFACTADYANALSAELADIAAKGIANDSNAMVEGLDKFLARWQFKQANPGVITGFKVNLGEYDRFMGGLKPGELTLIGAASGVGKSFMLSHMALESALIPHDMSGKPPSVAYFSGEMGSDQVNYRWLNKLCDFDVDEMLDAAQTQLVMRRFAQLRKLGDDRRLQVIEPEQSRTIEQVSREITIRRKQGTLDIAFIDYIQIIYSVRNELDRYKELDRIAARLKHLALSLDIPIVCAMQLNREAEREGEPQKHHIADCKGIYNAGDNVHLIWKPDTYLGDDAGPWANIAMVKTTKSRNTAPPPTLYFHADYSRACFEPLPRSVVDELRTPEMRARLYPRRGGQKT